MQPCTMNKFIFTIAISLLTVTLWRCSKDTLFLSNQNAVQVGFYSSHTGKDTTILNFSAHGLGRLKDSLIYKNDTTNKAFLPLRFDGDTTKFVLKMFLRFDTVTFIHTKNEVYISSEGGFTYNLHLKKIEYTQNFVDTAVVAIPGVNYNENTENVKIYIY